MPVKTTVDLLSLRSDAYVMSEGPRVELAPEREGTPPVIDLDSEHYKLRAGPRAALPRRAALARRLRPADGGGRRALRLRSGGARRVRLEGPREIEDGAVLEG